MKPLRDIYPCSPGSQAQKWTRHRNWSIFVVKGMRHTFRSTVNRHLSADLAWKMDQAFNIILKTLQETRYD